MNLRHLQYLISLAQEAHFGRAAERCGVTQPTLSAAIRQLEEELGAPLIERSQQRFKQLTTEGERAISWAQKIVADCDSLKDDVSGVTSLRGILRLACVPTVIPMVGLITAPFLQNNPEVKISVQLKNATEIEHGLADKELDAGLTYLDEIAQGQAGDKFITMPLFSDQHVLIRHMDDAAFPGTAVQWADLDKLPLCLLPQTTINRRIIDRRLKAIGITPLVVAEADALLALISMVRMKMAATILPRSLLGLFDIREVTIHPIKDEMAYANKNHEGQIGLIAAVRDPLPPMTKALLASVNGVHIDELVQSLLPTSLR